MAYESLYKFYDILIEDFPHKKIIDFLDKKVNFANKKVLDLCCGTGKALLEIIKNNGNVVGLDYSLEMLTKAKENLVSEGKTAELILGDINKLNIDRQFDIITMICDGLNYLKPKNLNAFLLKINNILTENGIFICEFSSLYKAENVLSDQIFYEDNENLTYFFLNKFNKKQKTVDINLTIFEKEKDKYNRYDDLQKQYFYSIEELSNAFKLFDIKILDTMTLKEYKNNSERILIIARKNG